MAEPMIRAVCVAAALSVLFWGAVSAQTHPEALTDEELTRFSMWVGIVASGVGILGGVTAVYYGIRGWVRSLTRAEHKALEAKVEAALAKATQAHLDVKMVHNDFMNALAVHSANAKSDIGDIADQMVENLKILTQALADNTKRIDALMMHFMQRSDNARTRESD